MVLAGEESGERNGRQGVSLQRRDSGRGRQNLRNRPEKSSFPQLSQRPLQREAGKRRPRLPPDVSGADAVRAAISCQLSALSSSAHHAERRTSSALDLQSRFFGDAITGDVNTES